MTDDQQARINAGLGIYGGTGPSLNSTTGIDWFEHTQEPHIETGGDPLARFVLARIIELELEPRGEIKPLYDQPGGAMAHRYAKHIRTDCVVFRQIVAEYLAAMQRHAKCMEQIDSGGPVDEDLSFVHGADRGLYLAVLAVANRWLDHREFQPEWTLA